MRTTCPQCGKSHRPGRALDKCRANSQFALGHYIIRGLKEEDPKMIEARREADAFRTYEKSL